MEELIKVNCVSEFVENVIEHHSKTKNSIESNVSCDSFYRGHSNISWPLIPYLYRSNLFHKERVLISEFRRLRPEDFSGLSEFEMLVKMQHFGLPTRLLDVTYNPLVALYFACCENGSDMSSACDGVVHSFFSVPTFWQENYAIRLIMRYVFECAGFKLDFRNFLKILLEDPVISSVFHQSQAFEETVIHYLSRVPCMAVRPALSNTRIVQQDGAFFLFGMRMTEREISSNPGTKGNLYINFEPYVGNGTAAELWPKTVGFLIPFERKKSILKDLRLLGIARHKLFPELGFQAEFVRDIFLDLGEK